MGPVLLLPLLHTQLRSTIPVNIHVYQSQLRQETRTKGENIAIITDQSVSGIEQISPCREKWGEGPGTVSNDHVFIMGDVPVPVSSINILASLPHKSVGKRERDVSTVINWSEAQPPFCKTI